MYADAQAAGGDAGAQGAQGGEQAQQGDDDVVDAEIVDDDKDKRKGGAA